MGTVSQPSRPGPGRRRRRLRNAIMIALAAPLGLILAALGMRAIARESLRAQTAIAAPAGIERLERIELGGVEQAILVRGEDQTKPVLLFLHGGPGYPAMPFAHRFDGELVKAFVVVHWDQRGAGMSYDPGAAVEGLTVEQYVSDAHELALYLRERFQREKIYLVGHSWGSVLGSLVAARSPELFHAYVSVAHTPSTARMIAATYAHARVQAGQAGDGEALAALEALGPPPYTMEQYVTFAGLSAPFVSGIRNLPANFNLWELLRSPAYSLGDGLAFFRGAGASQAVMYPQLLATDLATQANRFELPVYIMLGRYDSGVYGGIAEQHYGQLEAPSKELIWFEDSSHFPMYEEPGRFADELMRIAATHGG